MSTIACTIRGNDPHSTVERARIVLDLFERSVIEAPLHANSWKELAPLLPREHAAAIRLFLPYPRSVRIGSDYALDLGSTDPDERRECAKQGEVTLELAQELWIPRILVPCVSLQSGPAATEKAGEPTGRRGPQRSVDPEARRAFDSYRSTLYRLLGVADRRAVTLCVTPSLLPRELPNLDQAEACLREFSGAPLALWLDARRLSAVPTSTPARKGETEGDIGLPARIEALGNAVHGILLHDTRAGDDGLPPESGELDRKAIGALASTLPLWALAPREGAPAEEIQRGREFLAGLGEDERSTPPPLFG